MMETKKLVGIISSILLILNYVSRIIVDLLFKVNDQFIEIHWDIAMVVSIVGIVGFYYSISRYLIQHNYQIENKLVISLISFKILSFILLLILHYDNTIPSLVRPILSAIETLIIAVLGIKILLRQDKDFLNLIGLKKFVISWFTSLLLVVITSAVLTAIHKEELMSITFIFLMIPYIFGLLFFLKDKDKSKQPAAETR